MCNPAIEKKNTKQRKQHFNNKKASRYNEAHVPDGKMSHYSLTQIGEGVCGRARGRTYSMHDARISYSRRTHRLSAQPSCSSSLIRGESPPANVPKDIGALPSLCRCVYNTSEFHRQRAASCDRRLQSVQAVALPADLAIRAMIRIV